MMTTDLERALSKLRFDEQVLGYSLMTKTGRPFVSFQFPDELFPRIKDSINLYRTDLRLMTIDTDKGLVVLAPVDDHWILTVLYVPELQLGLAIAKTKNVLRLLEGIELPPPPDEFEESAEANLEVLESIAMQAASTEVTLPMTDAVPTESTVESSPEAAPQMDEGRELTPDDFQVGPSTVPKRGAEYSRSLSLDSNLYSEMKKKYRNFGFDVLMLVSGNVSVREIAESMFQPLERVVELLKWAASKSMIELPVSRTEVSEEAGASGMGRFVKTPVFEGDFKNVDPEDAPIVKMCDGSRTPEDIAKAVGVSTAKVIQIVAQYRKHGMKMVGKTI